MESDIPGVPHGSARVLKTVSRMPRTFINQLYAVDTSVTAWVSMGSMSYAACAYYLERQDGDQSCSAGLGEQVASVTWTFQVQTAAFGAVLLLNMLNLAMRQHLLPFKCNLLLLYINGVAFVTDLLLWRNGTTVLLSSSGRPFAPLRYVQWCHSTPTMIYMLALLADCTGWQLTIPLLSDVVMVVTGLLACYWSGPLKFIATVVSFGTFAVVVYYVYRMFQTTLSGDVSPEQRSTLRTVLALLLALWSAFPVVWLAAELQLMGPQAEAVAWGVCDYLAKVVFSSQLWQSNLTEVQMRRDRALEAWEASNRVEAVARLTALLKQRDDLLSTLSHELRTPLAGIVALSEGLCQEVSAALPSSAQTLATVRATATCMLNIVTSTLDSFAARRGGEPAAPGPGQQLPYHHPGDDAGPVAASVQLSPIDLRPLVETVTNVLRPLAHDGVAIVSDLPANLPLVAADVTRLSQVLYNLVGNAMRFTSQGDVRVAARIVLPEVPDMAASPLPLTASVPSTRCAVGSGELADGHAAAAAANGVNSLSSGGAGGCGGIWRYARPRLSASSTSSCSSVISYPPGSQVEVSVEDTGVGIAQELLDELFLPYRTGHTADQGGGDASQGGADGGHGTVGGRPSKSIGGTGLGLYLVRLALRAQGSDITAESAPGIGSVFRFRLPLAQQPQHQQQHDPQTCGGDAMQQAQQRCRRRGGSLDERRRADGELLGSQTPLPASACGFVDVRCGDTLSALIADNHVPGGARARTSPALVPSPVPLSSPSPTCPLSSPKPWIASATARLVKLSCGRAGGSTGGAFAGAAACSSGLQRPCTGGVPLQEASRSTVKGWPLRLSLDERTCLPPQPPRPPVGGRCRSSCAAGCCAPEPSAEGCAAPGSITCATEAALGVAPDAVPANAEAATNGGGVNEAADVVAPLSVATMATPVRVAVAAAQTPTPTPTAASSRLAASMAMTHFDLAHAAEEGRALARGGVRPNFRHRNNGTLQVLSVDDDPINQLVAGQMLTSQAWKVVKCMNGPEALAHLQLAPRPGTAAAAALAAASSASPAATAEAAASLAAAAAAAQPLLLPAVLPDCVLLDVMMPGMSGFEVCRKLRQHFSSAQLPIIIVSAKGDSAAVDEAFDSGADDYMTKPYKRAEMVARIKAQIRTRDSILDSTAVSPLPVAVAGAGATCDVASALPPGTAAVPSPLPPTAVSAGTLTADSTPRACSSAVAARALLGAGGGVSDQASPSPSPLVPPSQSAQDSRPTSVDVLLLQQPTPDLIKLRMEANRGGLDGSWGKVGLYKREGLLSRTGGVMDSAATTSPWDATPRAGALAEPATAPAAVLASPCGHPRLCDARTGTTAAASTPAPHSADASGAPHQLPNGPIPVPQPLVAVADAAVGTSRPLPTLPEGTVIVPSADAGAAPAAAVFEALVMSDSNASAAAIAGAATARSSVDGPAVTVASLVPAAPSDCGGDGNIGEQVAAAALMREVLTEVRRGRAAEADLEKLKARVGTLRTACCTLAAERDGWRRQARDLRALFAAGFSGAAAGEALSAAAPATPGSGAALTARGTPLHLHLTLTEALATAHGSRSSGDSLCAAAVGGGNGGGGGGGGAVAAQLEDLKKEAALLRQQLSMALASVGNGSVALGVTDTGNSRMLGLVSSQAPTLRPQRSQLVVARTLDSPHSAVMPGVGPGETDRSGGGADRSVDGPPAWGVNVFPTPPFAGQPDMFLTTETSGLSAGSGDGGTGAGKAAPVPSHAAAPADSCSAGCKQKRVLRRTGSSSLGAALPAAAATAAAPIVPGPRPALALEHAPAAQQANRVEADGGADTTTPPSPLAAFGSTHVCGIAELSLTPPASAASQHQPPTPPSRVDPPPPALGELRGSSAASNGRRSSVDDEMLQPSSNSRASVLPQSLRGSRAKGGGAGGAGGTTGGILRLLCSKGALPAGSPQSSSPRRHSQLQPQQQQHQQ